MMRSLLRWLLLFHFPSIGCVIDTLVASTSCSLFLTPQSSPTYRGLSMSGSHTLIVSFNFNHPVIKIIGPIRETTIEKLNQVLPVATTSTRSGRAGNPKFEYIPSPAHWVVGLTGQFCDQVGMSSLFLAILDALEEEGGWKLASTHALAFPDVDALQQDYYENYKFFFTRIM